MPTRAVGTAKTVTVEYEFTLRFSVAVEDANADQIVEWLGKADCQDALVGIGRPGRVALDFIREADSAQQAVVSAVKDVTKAIPNARLIEVGFLTQTRRGGQGTATVVEVLRTALGPLTTRIQCAFIFGSVARGAETEGSDIDVLVIGEVGFGEIVDVFYLPQSALGREINPMVFSVEEWRVWLQEKKGFVSDVRKRVGMAR